MREGVKVETHTILATLSTTSLASSSTSPACPTSPDGKQAEKYVPPMEAEMTPAQVTEGKARFLRLREQSGE
jgi:hypothetical protein